MQTRMGKRLFALALLFFSNKLSAQLLTPKYEMGIHGGVFIYQGDLTPEKLGAYQTPGINLGISGSRILNRSFSVRLNFSAGVLRGDDSAYANPEYRRHRNFRFRSPVYELSGQLVWNLLGHNYNTRSRVVSPYLFAGAGLAALRIRRDWSRFDATYFEGEPNTLAGLADDQQHRVPGVIPVIPIGAGIRYSITPKLDLQAESAYRFTFTDYLDGFSQSVNPAKKDSYQNISVGVVYKVGMKNMLDCPQVAVY